MWFQAENGADIEAPRRGSHSKAGGQAGQGHMSWEPWEDSHQVKKDNFSNCVLITERDSEVLGMRTPFGINFNWIGFSTR